MNFLTFNKKKTILFSSLLITSVLSVFTVYAEDTEVFFNSESAINPNVLFIMDNSSSMGLDENKINGKHRIQIMKDALSSVLTNAEDDLNVGIMNYGSAADWRNDYSNGVKFPITPINQLVKPIIEESLKDKNGVIMWNHHRQPAPIASYRNTLVADFDAMTVRQYLSEVANVWEARGNTPIVDALYEAALYYRGGAIKWQDVNGYGGRAAYRAAAHPSTYSYPADTWKKSENYPGHEYPYIPEWYSYGQCTSWYDRRIDKSHFRSLKWASRDWFSPWMKCPDNSGAPNYTPINGSAATIANCRIMRNDYLTSYNNTVGGAFDKVLGKLHDNMTRKEISNTDYEIQAVMETLTDAQLASITAYPVAVAPLTTATLPSRNHPFPRCRIIKEVRCGVGAADGWGKNSLYKCNQENAENCRSWNYEECKDPADRRIATELVCDYDQCTSRYDPPNYNSPIKGDCQSNYIVLMSDGKPEYSNGDRKTAKTKNWATDKTTQIDDMIGKACDDDPYFVAGTCGPELTTFLSTTDQLPGDTGVAAGDQFVHTMVIGFSASITGETGAVDYLKSLVTVKDKPETTDKEGFFLATDQAGLVKAFTDALDEIVVVARSQASPGYSVNVRSGLEHEDDIYIPVFDKNNSASWSGNLKKFKLVDVDGHRHIRGKTPKKDAMTERGLFKPEAWDYWSTNATADGNVVEKGGVAEKLDDPLHRKLFSNLTGDTNVSLWTTANAIQADNDNITNAMVGDPAKVTTELYRKKLIRYIRGWKNGVFSNGIARKHMGDMLHSEPVIITYDKGDAAGNGKQQYIFAGTNEGYLHAFDADTGEEKFAFMPKKLLKNIDRQFDSPDGQEDHVYGIDGAISYLKDGDNVYLFFGLRRGGRAYYAMDVTDVTKPKLMWKIDGADGGDFEHLGQSWSTPYITNVMHDGKKKTAIVFTGGHALEADYGKNDAYDESTVANDIKAATTNFKGDNIYIVNAKTGARLWSLRETMGNTDVEHEIPGGVRILDVNRNGLLDRMYFADIGGNVWRLDLHENLSDPTKSKIVKLAKLGITGSDTVARKFYNEPDVAQLSDNGKTIFTVSVGSGLRPHPINKVITDHMYILLDKQPLSKIIKTGVGKFPDPIEMGDLASVSIAATADAAGKITKTLTHNNFKNGSDDVTKITQTDKRGWYVEFPDAGEKVLAPSITFEGSIIFTTLVPKALTSGELINACESPGTQGRIYAMNILTGEASVNMVDKKDTGTNDNDVFDIISASEIPGRPQRIFNGLKCENGNCTHNVDIRIGKKNSEVGMKNVANIESIYWNDPEKQ